LQSVRTRPECVSICKHAANILANSQSELNAAMRKAARQNQVG
jgi:hypothetical protein